MQKGSLYQASGSWYCRYYSGTIRRSRYLGSAESHDVDWAERAMAAHLESLKTPTLNQWTEVYLTHAPGLRASTKRGYRSLYNAYIHGKLDCQIPVKDYRTKEVQDIINRATTTDSYGRTLSRTTARNLKHFLSGVMRYACQCGLREGNPVAEARIPHGLKAERETYAYTLEEIQKILAIFAEGCLPFDRMAAAAIGLAAYAGLRRSEIQGLRWCDIGSSALQVNRTLIRGIVDDTKTKGSKDTVPIIPQLATLLDDFQDVATHFIADELDGFVFDEDLEKLGARYIAKVLAEHGLRWRGWHAFRRGLASNLLDLGVDPLIIQRILRHSNVSTTLRHYTKARDARMAEALAKLSKRLEEGS